MGTSKVMGTSIGAGWRQTRYFLDTEFHEYRRNGIDTIELISIGMVREDGSELYMISNEFNVGAAFANEWLVENVLKKIYDEHVTDLPFNYFNFNHKLPEFGKPKSDIAEKVLEFVRCTDPEFWGYYADYDWVVFCWLWGRMLQLPEGFPMYCNDLRQMMKMYEVSKNWVEMYVPQGEDIHSAIADARWNKRLFEAMTREED